MLTYMYSYSCTFCSGGSYGSIDFKAQTVGGGENWDDDALVGSPSNFSNTIAEALANTPRQDSVQYGVDYQILQENLIMNVSFLVQNGIVWGWDHLHIILHPY